MATQMMYQVHKLSAKQDGDKQLQKDLNIKADVDVQENDIME